ncbi:marine proteobacterial sortase target protein [Kiloniella sp.]|uniref:marine proteobacterial sortase target protein n=1 Tax=Kiloniella sp. TaxID=1938587 RepID=UPI003B024BD8
MLTKSNNVSETQKHLRNNSKGIFTSFLAALSMLAISTSQAEITTNSILSLQAENPSLVTPNDIKRGSLLLKSTEVGKMVEALQLATNVEIDVSGPIARTKVTQRFRNPSDGWVEGTYVFPLPENSAVDTLKMQIGDRFIEGIIKPKDEAKKIYEKAKREGKKASLVEQLRPNMFTNSVANIGPGEIIVVQIEYQESVKQSNGLFSLRYPMVVAPRYSPKPRVIETVTFDDNEASESNGWGIVNDPVPDRDKITPPVLDPAKSAKTNPVSLTMKLSAGFPIGKIKSPNHNVTVDYDSKNQVTVSLADEIVPADRDFEITWNAKKNLEPRVALFKEKTSKGEFVLVFVTPPNLENLQENNFQASPREVIFVIDNSGSMSGPSMRQAKDSLLFALDKLTNKDRFNIVRFDDTHEILFLSAVAANQENISTAEKFVSSLEADGGTEMLPALKAALNDNTPNDTQFLRQIIFLTDGAIGNEQEMFDTIVKQRGRSRIFTVGIGSAPNSHFMNRASEFGQGTFTHIGSEQQVKERMNELFHKLENPVMKNLITKWTDTRHVETSPSSLPDLYSGEPIVLTARSDHFSGSLEISGRFNNQPWTIKLPLDKAAEGSGIDKLWARRRIAEYEGQYFLNDDWSSLDKSITKTALDFHLISRLTSLVAVDVTPSRPQGKKLGSQELPLNLPHGWDFNKVFGEGYSEPTKSHQDASLNQANSLISVKPTQVATNVTSTKSVPLPSTATTADLKIFAGMILLLLSILLLFIARKYKLATNREA